MKVLVISHNVFSDTSNMGRTLSAYFHDFDVSEIAQFYIHSEVPTSIICEHYYRITDREALKSIITRKCGHRFDRNDIQTDRKSTRTDTGTTAKIYQKGRNRTPLIYFARNLVWKMSAWNCKQYWQWVDDFNPDAIFFASGDYSFMYQIALKTAQKKQIPLIISCMDDYYFNNQNQNRFLGKLQHRLYMLQVKKTLRYASAMMTICDKMTRDYCNTFRKQCYTLHTPSQINTPLCEEKTKQIAYLGNLGFSRHLQLVEIGKKIKALSPSCEVDHIDVYSSEQRKEILSPLTEENGIVFHGEVNSDAVKHIIGKSLAVIHTESFEKPIADSIRYSVSTKIADSLASGTCIFAYGPDGIASIDYLKENQAAIVVTEQSGLEKGLKDLITNNNLRKQTEQNAVALAQRNHNINDNSKFVKKVLEESLNRES